MAAITHHPDRGLTARSRLLVQLWHDLDAPLATRRVPGTVPVAVVAGLIALVAAAFIIPSGWGLAYSDAQSHLTIARRLLDSRSELGLAQLGTVWLPVQHLLLAPFVASGWAWQTGWGAALLGAVCLGVAAAGLYRAAARWGAGRTGRLITVAALVINPTMLYLTSTALTEPVLIAAMAACIAGLAGFATRARLSSPGEVAVFAGLPATVAVLSRYEDWALTVTGTAFIAIVAWRRTRDLRRSLASALGFLAPPMAAIASWLAFNWVVFHNPLEFLNGEFSANAQQTQIVASGATTKGDLGATLGTLDLAVGSAVGWVTLGLAAVGALAVIGALRARNRLLFLVTAATSYLFLVVALYCGQAVIWNQATGASYTWNNRFGMASILPAALLVGWAVEAVPPLANRLRLSRHTARLAMAGVAAAITTALVAQFGWYLQAPAERSLVLTEAATSLTRGTDSRAAAEWLNAHYDGGGILLDETTWSNAALPQIGIPLREHYLRANGELFSQAVADPQGHARWVWVSVHATDPVTELSQTTAFADSYHPVFSNDTIAIYSRIGG